MDGDLIPNNVVIYERMEENIARITFNRPEKLNAINIDFAGEFKDHLDRAREQTNHADLIYARVL